MVCCPLQMYFDKTFRSTEFWLEWLLLLLFKLFMNSDIRAFGFSQYVAAISVTEVSVGFTDAVLMFILYQQRSPIYYLLVLVTIDHIDIACLDLAIMWKGFLYRWLSG